MRWLIPVLALLLSSAVAPAATLQARLIRASQNQKPSDAQLVDIHAKLQGVFGYEHYHQLGRKQLSLKSDKKERLNLGEGFVLFVRLRKQQPDATELDLEWFSGKAAICKQTLTLPKNEFVFIKGPDVGEDWIILALTTIE